jgi:hypothetical protein
VAAAPQKSAAAPQLLRRTGPLTGHLARLHPRSETARRSCVWAAALLGALPRVAAASPPEVLDRLVLHPQDPSHVLLSYANGGQGLLISRDGGSHFSLRCAQSIVQLGFSRGRPALLTSQNEVLIGLYTGLVRGDALGCGFSSGPESLAGRQVVAFAPHPADVSTNFVVTANPSEGQRTGLVRLDENTIPSEFGVNDTADGISQFSANQLLVGAGPDGALRFMESGGRARSDGSFVPVFRASDDWGASWREYPISDVGVDSVRLLAFDPLNLDQVLILALRPAAAAVVLGSTDSGQSWTPRLEVTELGGVAVAPDGRVWIGDRGSEVDPTGSGGLYYLPSFDAPPTRIGDYEVHCLGYQATESRLLACRRTQLGSVDLVTGEFRQTFQLAEVQDFAECPDENLAAACQSQLCGAWCGPLHYAQSPLCAAYDERQPALCGLPARAYDEQAQSAVAVVPSTAQPPAPPSPMMPVPGPPVLLDPATRNGGSCTLGRAHSRFDVNAGAAGILAAVAALLRRKRRRLATSGSARATRGQ